MREFKLRKGLDLPVSGAPEQQISEGSDITSVALVGSDTLALKPRLSVQEGDEVRRGQTMLVHKDTPDAVMVAPATGVVKSVHRGPRRVLESIVIDVTDREDRGIDFSSIGHDRDGAGVAEKVAAAGLWPSFRTRPYSKVPDPKARPHAIFVTAIDTEPLSPDAHIIINDQPEAFEQGLTAIAQLIDGATYLCQEIGVDIPGANVPGVEAVGFSGPHPAGLAGTHIHFLAPLTSGQTVWTIGYQDVIAIGQLMRTGHFDPSRVVALSGPLCRKPRLVKTILGASVTDLAKDDMPADVPVRLVSGSILSGRAAHDQVAYLGRYARQITMMEEDTKQTVLGWLRPMADKYAVQPVLGSAFSRKLYALTTNLNGGRRAMVPTGTFEELMPQDFLPTQLLRALLVMDTDTAQALGALELDEEDMGLCAFACPAKYEYGQALRDCLTKIEKEG